MSRRITQRRRRKKTRSRRGRRAELALAKNRPKLKIRPGVLDIARGHDGLLRGHPEPVLIVATYDARPGQARLLSRVVTRYELVRELPTAVKPRDLRIKGVNVMPQLPIAVVAVALEEDSSRDIQTLYAELDDADGIVAWPSEASHSIPGSLDQIPEMLRCESVAPIELKIAGRFPADWFRADKYIGAAATWIVASGRKAISLEIPACSADGRNDWLARVNLQLR